MSHQPEVPNEDKGTVSFRLMEMFVALTIMGIAVVVMWDSRRVGAGWAFDGPQAGYFPFYVGVIMFISSGITLVHQLVTRLPNLNTFVRRSPLILVLKVLIPSVLYVFLVGQIGLYVSAAILITFFMAWLGRYNILKAAAVGTAVPLIAFWIFEIMFLIPLPKGPLERALGF